MASQIANVTLDWSLDLIFKAKLNLESRNQTIHCGCQAAILKVVALKINMRLHIHTGNVLLKFGSAHLSQTKIKSPETEKSDMTTGQPLWKRHNWKSIGFRHFDNDVTENQQAPTHIHKYCATEVYSWYSKRN